MISSVSIIGLGKLGACMGACIASKGINVIGVDVNPKTVELVSQGRAPVQEPGLDELISCHRKRLSATSDYSMAILGSDLTFIVVATPSEDRGGFSLRYAAQAAREIGRALARKSSYHIVALTSTVLPGSTQFGILPVLEKASGKVCGRNFSLCYNPEFIALGSVIHDFLNPDFILIGESDKRAGEELEGFYKAVCDNDPAVARMSLVNAELTKIALNAYVTTKITFANMLAELCERLPGADVDVVSDALGLDRRIGRKYLTGAVGYGGPCFPRDNVALGFMARALGGSAPLAETIDKMNRGLVEKLVERVQTYIKPRGTVAVLGLAYKPFSHVVEESQGVGLARALSDTGFRVVGFDPLAGGEAQCALRGHAAILGDIASCLAQADCVVITTPDPAFCGLRAADFPQKNPPVMVFDCWRILREELSQSAHVRYVPLGVGSHEPALVSRLQEMWDKPHE